MAYAPGTRILYFSNPGVQYLGNPTGVSEAAGNSANNALSLNNTRVTVANWRVADTHRHADQPNGGQSWPVGSVQTVSWTSSALHASATIKLTYTNGSATYTIATGLARTATSYRLDRPEHPGLQLEGHRLQQRERRVRGLPTRATRRSRSPPP